MAIRWTTLFLDFGNDDFEAGSQFWSRVTNSHLSPARGEQGEFATLLPAEGDAYLRVQRLRSGASRCHLDLHLDPADQAPTAARARDLGATHLTHEPGLDVFTSPGGFPFCLVPWEGESTVPAAHPLPVLPGPDEPARLDQLCLDIPPALWEAETTFWAGLTGWGLKHSADSEFARLHQPGTLPLKLLLQRLDDPAPAVTAHPDFAAGERTIAEAHAALGAVVGPVNEHWTVMTDPRGRTYCLTERRP
ncbi:hypothetical protein LWF15_23555 [Kineosporia rhizophila]|uniref:VOC family protein n=1 Tax=Kineosporia rhizophila TaxID=84633 RepID=UPI001E3D263D|nr:VOC family protein [Kineosporia rhizophila]MCE0538480.1 hypothetical protein [Kineosporia rhizophila]